MKQALGTSNPTWAKTRLGDVRCLNCRWRGRFDALLAEADSRWLYCPVCTSSRWTYETPGGAASR